ncbi:MAG: hypothetical protein GC168_11115 [Candidatus Hydrogenedens sp.]|nr:hypothetical protein [Candidatus Hydrogenedens sp.]
MKMVFRISALLLVALTWTPAWTSHAEAKDLAATLRDSVDSLNPQQQEALLQVLNTFVLAPAAADAKRPESAIKVLREELGAYNAAVASGTFTMDRFLARLSDDFHNNMMGDKRSIVSWMKSTGLFSGNVPNLDFDLDQAQVEIEGDISTVTAISVDTPFGNVELEVKGRNESDGVWRITDISLLRL